MKGLIMSRKRITNVLIAALAFAAASHTAWGAAYIKWEGSDGHVHEQAVLSVEWGSEAEAFEQTSPNAAGAVVEELTLTMPYDTAAPKLLEYHRSGEVLPQVHCYGLNAGGKNEAIYMQYEMANVMVSGFQVRAGLAGEPPVVAVTLNFDQITYTEQDGGFKGSGGSGTIEVDFKLEIGQ
jgi:type VI protein secretion system component Hcp